MEPHRVVLTVPFMRHYAGSVFELYLDPTPDGWDPDERAREKISFNRRSYALPDSGRGAPARLSQSDTILCPPRLFDGVDLRTGPCRVTAVHALSGAPVPEPTLSDIGGHPGQGILVRLNAGAKAPFQITLTDLRNEQNLGASAVAQNPVLLDYAHLGPGFYRAVLESRDGQRIALHFIKCFPLVVLFGDGSREITGTMKTVY